MSGESVGVRAGCDHQGLALPCASDRSFEMSSVMTHKEEAIVFKNSCSKEDSLAVIITILVLLINCNNII